MIETYSGPEIILRSDERESCRFCKDIPVPTFLATDGVAARANHVVSTHKELGYQIFSDYQDNEISNEPVRFIEIGQLNERRSARSERFLGKQILPKPAFYPICLEHRTRMVRFAPLNGSFVRFRCVERECQRLWDMLAGYGHDTGHTLPYYFPTNPACSSFGHGAMFIRSITDTETEWACCVDECSETGKTPETAPPQAKPAT